MYIVFMEFESDPAKEAKNLEKHGVDFSTIPAAFTDPKRILQPNRGHSSTESRFQCIGFDGIDVLTFTFTLRAGVVRVINAGYWRRGRKFYEKENKK